MDIVVKKQHLQFPIQFFYGVVIHSLRSKVCDRVTGLLGMTVPTINDHHLTPINHSNVQ